MLDMKGDAKRLPLNDGPTPDDYGPKTGIKVRASECQKNDDGTFTVIFPATPLTEADNATLRKLFPNVTDRVYALLGIEALLAQIVE
jgi:hypothetical protein